MHRLFLIALLATAASSGAGEVSISLPPETAVFKPGTGVELAQANCFTCHSADYLAIQPPMPPKFWEATVKKMREKFGAPIPPEAVPGLLEYLTANYGSQ